MTQFSLFGAAVAAPTLADLDGVLLAGGWWVRQDEHARLSVIVAERWRAEAIAGEFSLRSVGCVGEEQAITAAEAGLCVRTGFHTTLLEPARAWTRGANQGPPADLALTAAALRLWCLAAGRRDDVGYLLATAEPDDAIHTAGGAQLSRHGVPAVSVSHTRGAHSSPGWRVSSAKRIKRLAELVGPAPDGAGEDWPSTH